MTKQKIHSHIEELTRLLRTHLVGVGQLTCHTGLSQAQVKQALLRGALTGLNETAAYWSIPLTAVFLQDSSESVPEQQGDLFDA